ncbi:MAG TPA: hypothetical protein PKO06_25110, partial [Candidatus Ozemobacteraceae bacterium]|nr:hypothetical protein [Candidatus Ozemobacteraceae bacterium]
YFYLSAPDRKGMLILFCRTPEQPVLPALSEVAAEVQRRYRGIRLNIIPSEGEPPSEWLASAATSVPASEAWNLLQRNASGSVWLDGTLISRQILSPSWWAIGTATLARQSGRGASRREWLGWALVLAGICCLAWFLEPWFAGSIRPKLLGAFLYASMIPLLIMGFAARQFLEERRMILEQERHHEVEQGLFRLDRLYSKEVNRLSWAFLEQYAWSSTRLVGVENRLAQVIPEFAKQWGFEYCAVLGSRGESLFTFRAPDGRTMSPKFLQYLGKLAGESMKRSILGEQSDRSGVRDLGTLEFLGLTPQVKQLDWGASLNIVGFFPLGTDTGRVTHVA